MFPSQSDSDTTTVDRTSRDHYLSDTSRSGGHQTVHYVIQDGRKDEYEYRIKFKHGTGR
jgi:hypothetical protein